MKHRLFSILFLVCWLGGNQVAQAYGLKFRDVSCPIADRTSYCVFSHIHPSFDGRFEVSFNLTLYPEADLGYVMRISGKDPAQVFNLFFHTRGDDVLFRLNQEGKSILIALQASKTELLKDHWFKVRIVFDLKQDAITLRLHNQEKSCTGVVLDDSFRPEIVFGKSGHLIEVPAIAISSLEVRGADTWHFDLDEVAGEEVYDQHGELCGRVENPVWLINEANHWRKEIQFHSATEAGSCYYAAKNEIYYFNRDSIWIYDILHRTSTAKALASRCPLKLFLVNCVMDRKQDRLYVYECYHGPAYTGPMLASLDLTTLEWRVESSEQLEMQLHHHDTFYDPEQQCYTIFGGFGNMHYSNAFYALHTEEGKWEHLSAVSGTIPCPRYFSAVGCAQDSLSVYLFGGMGNESGEQIVGREYYHDLYRMDLKTKRISKLWDISGNEPDVVPARGMIVPDDSCFYVLRYPESISQSQLHLYRFSIKDGSYSVMADSIPIQSDKITTNAHLYYNERLGKLFVTVQESQDDVSSTFTVYSLLFPPLMGNGGQDISVSASRQSGIRVMFAVALLLVVGGLVVVVYVRKRKREKGAEHREGAEPERAAEQPRPAEVAPVLDPVPGGESSSVYLFGDFAAFDRNGRNISYMFASRIRKIFCLILRYSHAEGISSRQLSDWMWPDKSKDKVKNSRGVAINQLRKILEDLDGIELVYEKGYFRFVLSEGFYCDYLRCMEIVSASSSEACKQEFLRIVCRGKFLLLFDDPLFDNFKQETERSLEAYLFRLLEEACETGDYATAARLAEAEFRIDPVNEKALSYHIHSLFMLKREHAAMASYQRFVTEYRKGTGEEFPQPFKNYWH